YKLHRVTGEVIWTLGGKSTDFAADAGVDTAWQHDFRAVSEGVYSIFDNGATPETHEVSRGLRIALDPDAMTAELIEEYVHPEELLSPNQGNMQVLPNGNVFIGWGGVPRISEFAPDGTLIQDWVFPERKETYRAYKFPWVGMPSEPPALAVKPDDDDVLTAYVSWNGDTRTVSWRLAAGATEDMLETRATVERTGFETAIPVSANDLFFRVEALDASGAVLGTSRVITTAE
ncbi:MAG: arylsulfotransferase family protein, partial [Chloroflexota bacterium]|nr:arylsulfotransferase family protein [Chloroflexota bacterium]